MAKRTVKGLLLRLGGAVALCAVGAVGAYGYARQWRPSVQLYPIQGVDISSEQGLVHWPTVKGAGADFAYLRATDGLTGRDESFTSHWAEASSAGLRRGAYHQFSLCRPAAEQATAFIATVPREEAALPPAIIFDFQENCRARPEKAQLQRAAQTLIDMIEAHSGRPAVLRVSDDFQDEYDITGIAPRTMWRARNFLAPDAEKQPWVMWRASDLHRIDGVEGPVDWNVVHQ